MPTIQFDHARVAYDDTVILGDISLTLSERRIGIVGANGSGKSTLTRLINGLIDPTSGKVLYDGLTTANSGREIRKHVGFVFSDAESQIVMPRVADDIAFSLRKSGLSKRERIARVDEMLKRFGLTEHADHSPHTLSGGEKQLLALAAVLVMEPRTIIADEPTTLLDLRNRRRIAHELAQLDQQLIVVTHDLELVDDFERILVLDDGAVVFDGSAGDALDYYIALMDARP
ncbi:energy-coupling factor ABC transporter ATP-binding protein [Corynebacterium cystitidis]|uniref:Biotin transport system ATP-binding protein n=1 Tax=Corynebacterium cystitidis DSM 20524 TaxID=1121357 RepID=A0A1H9P506_9CORY|nr:ABC transporter ATP-binding protein [Corynebacterium cystitidis]WJY82616.1 Biotin transport ATP-binding protein BioM [Corynebacterium cystitidis DSM 20524]SER43326.1 biotin transport system ATP-binding protein [Corynebacterium cystitidis DSM 20524]SNV72724.1 methionine ABC transport system ATP-binding protein [Corynebacterium cystitidis]